MKRARIIHIAPEIINRVGCSIMCAGVVTTVSGAFTSDLGVSLIGAGIGAIGAGMCGEFGTGNAPVPITIPWPVPMPTLAVVEPRREPAAYPPAAGQCFVCGIIDPDREKSLGTANHPECVEWLGDWKPPVPHFEGRNRPPIILPSRSGMTMDEFANNMRGIMGPAKPKPTPVETTADAVRRNAHMCTVLCAYETHGDGRNDLCGCSTCACNRGDEYTEQDIREAYDDLNARYAQRNTDLHQLVKQLRADVKTLKSGRLADPLDEHLSYQGMPPSHVLGYTVYPKHGYYIRGVCQACKLIADYHARPQWLSKNPPDPGLLGKAPM